MQSFIALDDGQCHCHPQPNAQIKLSANRMNATSSGVHHFIRHGGIGLSRAGSSSSCLQRFQNFSFLKKVLRVEVLSSGSLALARSSSAGTMLAPLLWFTASHRSSLSKGNGRTQAVKLALVSSEYSLGSCGPHFHCVECGSWVRWVVPRAH